MRINRNRVVTEFNLPDQLPPEVAEAKSQFDEAALKWAKVVGQIEDATAAVEQAKLKDAEAIAAAYEKSGSLPKDPDKHERAALSKVAGLRQVQKTAEDAVDQAGNEMLDVIEAHRAGWLDTLRTQAGEKLDGYHAAIQGARDALTAYQRATHGIGWLERFNVSEARVYRHTRSFHGAPRAIVEDKHGGTHDADALLQQADRVGEPTWIERREQRRAEVKPKKKTKGQAPGKRLLAL